MAGESARAKAVRLRQSADRWDQGADGEEATATALMALPPSWRALHDLAWPGRQHANIDHVVVGPPGVFVIDSKNWSGRVAVEGGVLRQDGRDRTSSIQAAVEAAAAVSAAASSVRFDHVHAVLCLMDQDLPSEWVDGVLVCSAAQLVEELTSYVEVLPGGVGIVVAAEIQRQLSAASGPAVVAAPVAPTFMERCEQARQAAGSCRKPMGFGALARVAVGAALAVVLLTQPQLVTSVPTDIADFVVQQVNPHDSEQDQLRNPDKNRKKQQQKQQDKQQRQNQR